MRTHRLTKIAGFTTIAALLLGGAVAYGTAGQGGSPPGSDVPGGELGFEAQVTRISPQITGSFSVFRDGGPASVPAADAPGAQVAGMNPALARTVATPRGPIQVIPGDDSVCTKVPLPSVPGVPPGAGVGCASVADARLGRAVSVVRSDDLRRLLRVTGIVPDGVGSVQLTGGSAGTQTVPVHQNAWSAGPTDAAEVRVPLDGGQTTVDLP